jgi:DNA-binding NarL/FixJ family response regulator
MSPRKRVLIAHADPQTREQVRNLAESRLGLGTVQADSFEALLDRLREEPETDLVIVDLDLPGMFWEVGLRHLATNKSGMRIAVLFNSPDGAKLDTLDANLAALVPMRLPKDSLADVLEQVLEADDPDAFPGGAPQELPSGESPSHPHIIDNSLTARQCDVLRLLSQGLSNLEIADSLGIAEGTVKVHINAAFRTLGVHNRVSASVAFREYFEKRSARAMHAMVSR